MHNRGKFFSNKKEEKIANQGCNFFSLFYSAVKMGDFLGSLYLLGKKIAQKHNWVITDFYFYIAKLQKIADMARIKLKNI